MLEGSALDSTLEMEASSLSGLEEGGSLEGGALARRSRWLRVWTMLWIASELETVSICRFVILDDDTDLNSLDTPRW